MSDQKATCFNGRNQELFNQISSGQNQFQDIDLPNTVRSALIGNYIEKNENNLGPKTVNIIFLNFNENKMVN